MYKKIFLIFLFSFLLVFQISNAEETIKTGITYNEATSRVEAFRDIEYKIQKAYYKNYLKDKEYKQNIEFIKNKILQLDDKSLCPFYAKNTLFAYAVIYKDKSEHTFYYNTFGNLLKFDITKGKNYPRKTISYSKYGNLISVAFSINENEQFIYNKNGELIAHWKDEKMLDSSKAKIFQITRGMKE